MDFWRAVAILSKRKWLIILSVIVCTTLTFSGTRLVGNRWQATVRFFAPPEVLPLGDNQRGPFMVESRSSEVVIAKQQAAVYTAVVRSPDVLQPAMKKMKVDSLPPELIDGVKFEVLNARVFELQVVDSNPIRAGDLANALAESFERQYRRLYSKQPADSVKFLEERLVNADRQLDIARHRQEEYRQKHQLMGKFDEQANALNSRLNLARTDRDNVQQRLADARGRLQTTEGQLSRTPSTIKVERTVVTSPLVQKLQEQLADFENQLTVLKAKYTDQNIQVKQVQATRDALAARLQQEMKTQPKAMKDEPNPERQNLEQTVRDLRQEIQGNEGRLSSLDSTISSLESQRQHLGKVEVPLAVSDSEVEEAQNQRQSISARLQQARLAQDVVGRQNPLVIMDRVGALNPPVNTTQGRTTKLIMLSALCALLGSAGLIIAFDSIDRRIRTLPEAELMLPARVLAAIPQPLGPVTAAALPRAAELHPLSLHAETFRFLAVHLLGVKEQGIRALMIASAKAEQGTTVTATNLGITLAQAGQRVILVDANLRTPRLHEIFHVPNRMGLADLLKRSDAAALEQALQPTGIPNLRVVTSGDGSENPWELFRSENLREVGGRLRDLADYVIYDTPSALAFTDALSLAATVDGALLCVRALEPTSGAEQRLVELLEQANVTVLGNVLNDVPASVLESYQNYQRYYPAAGGGTSLPDGFNGDGPHGSNGANGGSGSLTQSWIKLPAGNENDGYGTGAG